MDTEWWWDLRQTPKVHVYLPLLGQALINHCYLPLVAHGAFVLHTMRTLLHDGCWQFVSSGAAGGWYTCTHTLGTLHTQTQHTHTPLINTNHISLPNQTHSFENECLFSPHLLVPSQCGGKLTFEYTPSNPPTYLRFHSHYKSDAVVFINILITPLT